MGEKPAIHTHMRALADSYTLLAFLRQTPDVQGAVEKMFAHGDVWLDASVILPLLAETLLDDETGRFTRMIEAASDAGLSLFVRPGAVEEVEKHLNRGLAYTQTDRSRRMGSAPYIFERYIASGRIPSAFGKWLETFRGTARPHDDIIDYLRECHNIKERSLDNESKLVSNELRYALQEYWYEAHRRRRERNGTPLDDSTIRRLVDHDVECYCGVVSLRRGQDTSPFGHTAWWLTIDQQAYGLTPKLKAAMRDKAAGFARTKSLFRKNFRNRLVG